MSTPGAPEPAVVLTVANLARQGDLVRRAANLLRRGGLVAFPTECSFMLACRAEDGEALGRLAGLLQRREGLPWTLYCGETAEAEGLLQEPGDLFHRFAEHCWPGPVVLMAPRSARVPERVHAGLSKVALRVPDHRLAQAFLSHCKCPVVAATARLRGQAGMVDRDAVLAAFGGGLGALLEGREPPGGLEPAVLDLAGRDPRILQMGLLRPREVFRLAGRPVLLSSDVATPARFTRFSPQARLIVVEGEPQRVARRLKFLRETLGSRDAVAVVVTPELAASGLAGEPGLHVLPGPERPEELSEGLFGLLRRFEESDSISTILVEGLPREGPTANLMERLSRVAHQVINTEDPGYAGQAGLQPRERVPRVGR